MIERASAYKTSRGKTHASLMEAQVEELFNLCAPEDEESQQWYFAAECSLNAVFAKLIGNADKAIAVLKLKERKARGTKAKAVGRRRRRSADADAGATHEPKPLPVAVPADELPGTTERKGGAA